MTSEHTHATAPAVAGTIDAAVDELEERTLGLEGRVAALEAKAHVHAAEPPPVEPPPVDPPPVEPPPVTSGFLLADLDGLPTSGAAWDAMLAQANATWPAPDLCNQDNKVGVSVLAAAMVDARLGTTTRRAKIVAAIGALMASQRDGCVNAALAAGRQLGAWVLASDYAGYRDPEWLAFLSDIRDRQLGGHGRWTSLAFTQTDSSNNWGAFAQGAMVTIDAYLDAGAELDADWRTFRGFTGVLDAYAFRTPSISQPSWLAYPAAPWTPIQQAPGNDRHGAPTEDAWRSGAYPAISKTYVQETMQGLALAAEILSRGGYPAWPLLRPLADFATRWAVWNASSVGYHLPWWYNARLGIAAPTQPANIGRTMAYTDWWVR